MAGSGPIPISTRTRWYHPAGWRARQRGRAARGAVVLRAHERRGTSRERTATEQGMHTINNWPASRNLDMDPVVAHGTPFNRGGRRMPLRRCGGRACARRAPRGRCRAHGDEKRPGADLRGVPHTCFDARDTRRVPEVHRSSGPAGVRRSRATSYEPFHGQGHCRHYDVGDGERYALPTRPGGLLDPAQDR